MNGKREFGDYQTPYDFALEICNYLKYERNINPSIVLEPTCGTGNFLRAALIFNAKKYYGIEINPEYCKICIESFNDERLQIINKNFLEYDLGTLTELTEKENILIIGNPPWINNAALSVLSSSNVPKKVNFKKLNGFEALTGSSNFDICEYIILKIINKYANNNAIIAMLCKMTVARNIFKELNRNAINFLYFDILEFDASKIFNVNVNACLLLIHLSKEITNHTGNIYNIKDRKKIKSILNYSDEGIYNNLLDTKNDFDGNCCFEWRQGVKHDCSKIMELSFLNGQLINGKKETVDVEDEIIFPLIKSSMFKNPIINEFKKYVIITQKKINEDTKHLKFDTPKTWKYLSDNIQFFNKRKSVIYNNAPAFSMFGIGDYSYSRYKVGVSGFYKNPTFSVLFSNTGKPVMLDDTSYFICFTTYNLAYTAMIYLNSNRLKQFLRSITFLDAKRPYTKKILSRIDFSKVINAISFNELIRTERELGLNNYITNNMINEFFSIVNKQQISLF